MKPTKDVECTLVDVLDRILDKGVILNADVIISVAGVPLIGVNLRAALAGIETMLDYGMMEAWDESIRKYYAEEISEKSKPPLFEDEKILLQAPGSYYYNSGIYSAWQHGYIYLTDKRIFLFRKEPAQVLFETEIEKINGLMIKETKHLGKERKNLYLSLEGNKTAMFYTEKLDELKNMIESKIPLSAKA
ncbi:MAG: gas vesicle protein [Thermoplasmatales archaeon]|nr:gas vesicle protein [Thermoplasmatales archaeon]